MSEPKITIAMHAPGYDELARILLAAFNQSSAGKGKERHANSLPWDQQPILTNARIVGPGGPAFQAMKKAGESVGLANRKDFERAKAEALGTIVYAAALYKLYEEMEAAEFLNNPASRETRCPRCWVVRPAKGFYATPQPDDTPAFPDNPDFMGTARGAK